MTPAQLLSRGQQLAAGLPDVAPRSAALPNLTATGAHPRHRAGPGGGFWQYRRAEAQEAGAIDWRRSARSDHSFVQEKEWQTANLFELWVDGVASMAYSSNDKQKITRARVLAMALACALIAGGESVGVTGAMRPAPGRGKLPGIAASLLQPSTTLDGANFTRQGANALLFSDFLADLAPIARLLAAAREARVRGILVQVLDPWEISFPFTGATIFADMAGRPRLETGDAAAIAGAYRARLAQRQEELRQLARRANWHMVTINTNEPAATNLAQLWQLLREGG